MIYQHLTIEIRDAVGWFRFNRPPVNAIDWDMLSELAEAFDDLSSRPDVRVIVLATALERYFSAGADLHSFRSAPIEQMEQWVASTHRLAVKVRSAALPVLAAIKGTAIGGGLEMALHADLRFADCNARLGQPEVNIAFIPPVAGTQALVRLVGRSNAFQMLYGGELIDARKALSIGLVDFVSDAEKLENDVQEYAERLIEKPANALAAIRRCLIDGGDKAFHDGLEVERIEAAGLAGHPNFQLGIEAFLNKTKPRWT